MVCRISEVGLGVALVAGGIQAAPVGRVNPEGFYRSSPSGAGGNLRGDGELAGECVIDRCVV